MNKFLPVFYLCFIVSFASSAQGLKDRIERTINGYASTGNFNGTVLVAKRGTVISQKGYGYADVQRQVLNTENSIYAIGQCTEVVTMEEILQLDSKGKLGLEDKLSKYFPDYPNGNRINIRQLLTHTSGIYDYSQDSVFAKSYRDKEIKKQTIIDIFENHQPAFFPGMQYGYSASDYFLLGCIIDKVARWKYEYELDAKIFQVCDMKHSGFDFKNLESGNKVVGYDYLERDRAIVAPLEDSSYLSAAGAMYSTVGDLFHFHQALHWHKLLPKDWQDLGYAPVKGDNAPIGKVERIYGKAFAVHEGSIPGFTGFIMRQEEDDLCIVILSNNGHPPVALSTIADGILKCLYGAEPKKAPEKKEAVEKPVDKESPLGKFTGKFDFTPSFYLIFTQQGDSLLAESPELKGIPMVADGPYKFHMVGVAATIYFTPTRNGTVNKAVLRQGGEETPGKRVK